MNRIMYVLIILLFIVFAISSYACEITFSPDKPKYKIGDTVILKMIVKWTHKTCIKEAVEPALKLSDMEMTAKTKFKETAPGLWEIKYKMKVIGNKAAVNAYEDCSKGGGTGNIKLQIEE
jgi:hypothetical protein